MDAKRKKGSGIVSFTIGDRTYSAGLATGKPPSEIELEDLPEMFQRLSGIYDSKLTADIGLEGKSSPRRPRSRLCLRVGACT